MDAKPNEKRLSGQIAWVTGSSRGIGRVNCGPSGLSGRKSRRPRTGPTSTRAFNEADSLDAVAHAIAAAHHGEVLPVWGDLSDAAVVKQVTDLIRRKFGQIDILVKLRRRRYRFAGRYG